MVWKVLLTLMRKGFKRHHSNTNCLSDFWAMQVYQSNLLALKIEIWSLLYQRGCHNLIHNFPLHNGDLTKQRSSISTSCIAFTSKQNYQIKKPQAIADEKPFKDSFFKLITWSEGWKWSHLQLFNSDKIKLFDWLRI